MVIINIENPLTTVNGFLGYFCKILVTFGWKYVNFRLHYNLTIQYFTGLLNYKYNTMEQKELKLQSSGKKYNNEKGIISLTSWKKRINTVSKTLYSLLKHCSNFHIVLVLSEEEFPKKEEELPENLRLFIDNELIEVLWVYKNYKVTKKLVTCCKYTNLPIIITDDDVIIVKPFADELYQNWVKNKTSFISYVKSFAKPPYINAAAGLIPPNVNAYTKKQFEENKMKDKEEDDFLRFYARDAKIKIIGLHDYYPFYFHDEIDPITGSQNRSFWITRQRYS